MFSALAAAVMLSQISSGGIKPQNQCVPEAFVFHMKNSFLPAAGAAVLTRPAEPYPRTPAAVYYKHNTPSAFAQVKRPGTKIKICALYERRAVFKTGSYVNALYVDKPPAKRL